MTFIGVTVENNGPIELVRDDDRVFEVGDDVLRDVFDGGVTEVEERLPLQCIVRYQDMPGMSAQIYWRSWFKVDVFALMMEKKVDEDVFWLSFGSSVVKLTYRCALSMLRFVVKDVHCYSIPVQKVIRKVLRVGFWLFI
ncbi:uncharacterized protein LOC119732835 [Patiria miniata]|uniref:Uncharacterized protein n=1 Tax=Patiria miniata TaxID=46514 RepID=A0A914AF46_PATMI|nr:uncharacterized protein LOC119732835 [Patiria miniata]